jgi:hypothetical protein
MDQRAVANLPESQSMHEARWARTGSRKSRGWRRTSTRESRAITIELGRALVESRIESYTGGEAVQLQ